MKHAKLILFLGILVSVTPFLGFPTSWKNIIFGVLGLMIILLSFRMMALMQDTQVSDDATYLDSDYEDSYSESVSTTETIAAHEQ